MKNRHLDTILAESGRHPEAQHGIVNPPVWHASTVTYPSLAALEEAGKTPYEGVVYGRFGTPTTWALEEAVAELEGGYRSVSLPSGLGALSTALLAFAKAGDHILMTDSVYFPTRKLGQGLLAGFGVETSFYDPMIGAGIAAHIRPNTRIVFVEAPGSLSFEVQDIPAIADIAHRHGALVMMDNTWSAGVYYKPFAHGVDISIQAATKYIAGHSDAMIGLATAATRELWEPLKKTAAELGICAGPDDCYLALRGLRTLGVRLARHQETGLALAHWLAARPEVVRVVHPALPGCPGHDIWKRDFTGASGLFAVILKPAPRAALAALLDGLEHFGLGYSWGGYESLIVPADPRGLRSVTRFDDWGTAVRIAAGLEHPADLIADLEAGLERYRTQAQST